MHLVDMPGYLDHDCHSGILLQRHGHLHFSTGRLRIVEYTFSFKDLKTIPGLFVHSCHNSWHAGTVCLVPHNILTYESF